jgi:hypothetical protein
METSKPRRRREDVSPEREFKDGISALFARFLSLWEIGGVEIRR